MRDADLNAALDLLDVELRDVNGHSCGRVDDLELEGGPGQQLAIAAILVGTSAWRMRLPSWVRLGRRAEAVRVDWREILEIGASIRFARPAREYGLNRGELTLGRWLSRVRGS